MKLRRFLAPLFAALAVLIALLFLVAWLPLRQARDAWRAGHDADAIDIAERWSQLRLWPARYHQLLAAAYLTAGNRAAAQPHLQHMSGSLIDEEEVARRLFARERYDDFLVYDAAARDDRAALYRAAALAATNRASEAMAVPIHNADPKKLAFFKHAIAQPERLLDRNDQPLGADFAPLAASLPRGTSIVETTLDPAVQRAALQALGNYRGAIVAIDPRTNELLAIASSAKENLAIERQYEPGSVIKILTGLNALSNGVEMKFPYVCTGELRIDGRRFGDWVPTGHGTLGSVDDALAVSCNVFFADVGLRLGRDRLQQFMKSAGFDGQTNTGVMQVPLGKLLETPFNNFETAFLAIGLKHESINAFHLAMLASAMANRGILTPPRLLRARRSLLGDVIAQPPAQGHVQLGSRAAAETMIQAMQAVVTNPRGTGRRTAVPGLTMAMKTGTAGERTSGLEALIMAFAPVEQPKIAFAVIAEDAGPAEIAGAKIAHDFLEAIRPRLQ
ncbi:MAG TPA: penicillin-binding transpeptidase domain-containing protein [Thermoanaerobaculia bacterium]|nr:penicillin-binding transpeptidase domain-containing protein [Thermoanaerobaculia bacterium]